MPPPLRIFRPNQYQPLIDHLPILVDLSRYILLWGTHHKTPTNSNPPSSILADQSCFMFIQTTLRFERLITHSTGEQPHVTVRYLVCFQVTARSKRFSTHITCERFLLGVDSLVDSQTSCLCESLRKLDSS